MRQDERSRRAGSAEPCRDRATEGRPPAGEPIQAVIILRGDGTPALRRTRSGSSDARIRDAVALTRVGGDGRPHPRSGLHPGLRVWAAGADARPNWLAGALDPHTGPALSAIHKTPGCDWTVEQLARAMRPVPVERCAHAACVRVGKPPATYLANIRRSTPRPHLLSRHVATGRAHRREHRLHVGGSIQSHVRGLAAARHRSLATGLASRLALGRSQSGERPCEARPRDLRHCRVGRGDAALHS